jgi:phospholipase C
MRSNRRELLKNAGLASGALFVGACRSGGPSFVGETVPLLPSPESTGIEHIVVVTMENRSFDHFLGWLPNADGKQAGLTFDDNNGVAQPTHSLSGDDTGCPHPSPDHSYNGGRVEYDNGQMDGFLRAGTNDVYSIGYYGEADIPFMPRLGETTRRAIATLQRSSDQPFPIGCSSTLRKPIASTTASALLPFQRFGTGFEPQA